MNPEDLDLPREREALQILERALDLPPAAVEAFVTDSCRGDRALQSRVNALLKARADELVLPGVALTAADLLGGSDPVAPPRFRSYRIRRLIAAGGMARVYEAVQDRTHREVALKVVRAELLSEPLVRRFEFEAQLLGRLRHPCIAQIIEAGVEETPEGPTPFLALEKLEGHRLDEFLRDQPVSRRRCLQLFREICGAVHHAHQRGVIHCDLKPSNIVVDADGRPRVLDFGIARTLLSEGLLGEEAPPRLRMGTPRFMSPEQRAGTDVDARSDVYALGVTLQDMLQAGPVGQGAPARLDPGGDLECIVGKATRAAVEERYESAAALASDIRCHEEDWPVSAHPAGRRYLMAKFYRRHRLLVHSLGAVGTVLVATLLVVLQLLQRAHAAEERTRTALQEEAQARAVAEREVEFLARFFGAADPFGARGPDLTVAEALRVAASAVADDFADAPVVRAALETSIGMALGALGLPAEAEAVLRSAHQLRQVHLGEDHLDTIASLEELGVCLREQGQLEAADRVLCDSLARHEELLGARDARALRSAGNLAQLRMDQGLREEARALAEETLAAQEEVLGPAHDDVGITRETLAAIYCDLGQLDDAERLQRQQLDEFTRRYGERHARTMISRNNLLVVLEAAGKVDEALRLSEGLIEGARAFLGKEHPSTILLAGNIANLLRQSGRQDEAEQLFQSSLEELRRVLGEDHPRTLQAAHNLGGFYCLNDRLTEAEQTLAPTLERERRRLGDDHPDTLLTMSTLAAVYANVGRRDEALKLQQECSDRWTRREGPEHPEAQHAAELLERMRGRAANGR